MRFTILSKNNNGPRVAELETEHGRVLTPTYMPVGTFGAVKLLDAEEMRSAGALILLSNAFHLESTVGAERINRMGGLAKFTGWNCPTLTDSGGYQVSYMWRSGTHSLSNGERKHKSDSPIEKITDEGARVRSLNTGERYWLTPERAMEMQALIGADIVMAFDQPTFDTDSFDAAQTSVRRAHEWIIRSKRRWEELKSEEVAPAWQAFFPIIQGGRHVELRKESAKFAVDLETEGLAIAGESIGIVPAITAETLEMVKEILPTNKPLYAMGLGGGPEGFFEAVLRGVDMFDNTSPTRLGRCGLAFISPNEGGSAENHFRMDVTKGRFQEDSQPIDSACRCKTCVTYSRGYLYHLFQVKDPLGMRLVSYHNVSFMCNLGGIIREAIMKGSFKILYETWLR